MTSSMLADEASAASARDRSCWCIPRSRGRSLEQDILTLRSAGLDRWKWAAAQEGSGSCECNSRDRDMVTQQQSRLKKVLEE